MIADLDLYRRAVAFVAGKSDVSISLLQRHLQLGFYSAANLKYRLERAGRFYPRRPKPPLPADFTAQVIAFPGNGTTPPA